MDALEFPWILLFEIPRKYSSTIRTKWKKKSLGPPTTSFDTWVCKKLKRIHRGLFQVDAQTLHLAMI